MKRKLKVLINNLYFQLVVILILLLVVILILLFIAFLVFQNNQTILMALATITGAIIGGFITKTYSIDIVKEQLKHQLTLVSAEQRIIKHQEAIT